MKLGAKIDWCAFTVFDEENDFFTFWDEHFSNRLGKLVEKEHGGRGYQKIFEALAGAKVYAMPGNVGENGFHFHIELPGDAVSCLVPNDLIGIYYQKLGGEFFEHLKIRFTRIDLAVDHEIFTPEQVWDQIKNDQILTYASRKSFELIHSPFEIKDTGEEGTRTVYIGSSNSERRVRIYDKHGFTRVEMQLRKDWANKIAEKILCENYENWLGLMLGFIDSYLNFQTEWWKEFVAQKEMRDIIVKSARAVSLQRLTKWMELQVAPGLFAFQAVLGTEEFLCWLSLQIIDRPERLKRWRSVMEMV